jgi:hypothetical protein
MTRVGFLAIVTLPAGVVIVTGKPCWTADPCRAGPAPVAPEASTTSAAATAEASESNERST